MVFKTRRKSTCAGNDDHADPDAAYFSALMDSLEMVAGSCPEHKPPHETSITEPFSYNGNDLDEFASLMTYAVSPALFRRTPARRNPGKRDAAGNIGYTDSDRQHFDQLMLFDSLGSPRTDRAGVNEVRSAGTRETVESFGYSPQDMEAFDTLMPAKVINDDGHSQAEPETRFGNADTPARHIRIIDYDKQREADKKRVSHGNVAMKIRYFD